MALFSRKTSPTFASITAGLSTMIAQLDSYVTEQLTAVEANKLEILTLEADSTARTDEVFKASAASKKIAALLA